MNIKNISYLSAYALLLTTTFIAPFSQAGDMKELEDKIHSAIEELRLHRHSIESSYNYNGEVILSGYVSSEADKEKVSREIEAIPGVSHVENTLTVKDGGEPGNDGAVTTGNAGSVDPAQENVRKHAMMAVKNLPNLGAYEMDLTFSGHTVLLTGIADTPTDIKKINQAVQKEAAPFTVVNNMTLRAVPTDPELVTRVKTAFDKEKNLQAEGISVTAQDGVITLTGEKSNHRIVDRILSVANMVDGVKRVDSQIAVK